jgi:hypothetical protein
MLTGNSKPDMAQRQRLLMEEMTIWNMALLAGTVQVAFRARAAVMEILATSALEVEHA